MRGEDDAQRQQKGTASSCSLLSPIAKSVINSCMSEQVLKKKYPNFISIEKTRLRISFIYDPKKVALLRRIKSARFEKENKSWTISLKDYEKLKKLKLFARGVFNYDFTENEIREKNENVEKKRGEALARIAENPFCVASADIEVAGPEFVFYIKDASLYLRTKTKEKLLEDLPGAQLVKKENAYFFPVRELGEFLKKARDKKLLFAVEEKTGTQLKKSAELRAQILKTPEEVSAEALRECSLVPYLEKHGSTFRLCCYTNEQLQTLFPQSTSFQERKRCAENLSEDDLLRLLAEAKSTSIFLFKTKDVFELLANKAQGLKRFVEKNPDNFPREILACHTPDIFWHAGLERAALYIEKSLFEKYSTLAVFKKLPLLISINFLSHYALSKSEQEFLEFYREVRDALKEEIPTSETFVAHLEKLKARASLLKKRNAYQSLKDCSAELENKDLEEKLFPHQRVAVAWLKENAQAFLGDDMGLGKTLSVLASFADLKARGEIDFLLVVCPNSLTRNWQKEASVWIPGRRLHLLPQTRQERVKNLDKLLRLSEDFFDGLILNFETARLDYVLPKLFEILENKRVLLCVDESQRAKNAQSRTFAALKELSARSTRRVLLSGTPIPKDIGDIWAQIYLLDQGERFGENYYTWLEKIAVLGNKYSEYAIKSFRKEEVEGAISRVQELLLRRKKEDVLSLPEKTFSERYLELKGEQKKRYEEVRKELLLRISSVDGKTYTKEISSILEEYLRAVQIASNPRLVDETWVGEPAKFLELDEIVDEIVGENEKKLLIWTSYIKNTEELCERYKKYGTRAFNGNISTIEREKTIRAFQDLSNTEVKILVAIPAAGGVGITLTATQTAVYLDKTWNAEHWLQSIDRIHRIGQTGSVQIISLNACPIDYLIQGNLAKKEKMQRQLLGDDKIELAELDLLPTREELLEAVR